MITLTHKNTIMKLQVIQKMPNKLMILFLTALSVSCMSDYSGKTPEPLQARLQQTKRLPLPETSTAFTLTLKHFEEDGEEFLLWRDRENNSILIYDLDEERLDKRIQFVEEGPGKVPSADGGFSVFGFDSIYLSTYVPGKLYQVDTAGNLQNVIISADTSGNNMNSLSTLNSRMNSDLVKLGEKLAVPLRFPFFKANPGQMVIDSIPIFSLVDLEKGLVSSSPIAIPAKVYNESDLPLPRAMGLTAGKGDAYFCFECDPNIYSTKDFKTFSTHETRSGYHEECRPITKGAPFERVAKSFMYRGLYYDEYRNRFYRVAKLPTMEEVENYREEGNFPSRFSVIILDENLNILDEILFSGSEYSMLHCFVGEAGFYLMRSPYNPDYEEDYLTFDAFTFEQV